MKKVNISVNLFVEVKLRLALLPRHVRHVIKALVGLQPPCPELGLLPFFLADGITPHNLGYQRVVLHVVQFVPVQKKIANQQN